MSELEPTDSRVVHGNAEPKKGDERFADKPTRSEQFDRAHERLDDDAIRNPEQAPSKQDDHVGEDGLQQEPSRDNDARFEASDLDRGAAQYQSEPLIQQQHQSDDWSEHNDRGETQLRQPQQQAKQSPADPSPRKDGEFETGQADYGSAQAKAEDAADDVSSEDDDGSQVRQQLVEDAAEGDLTDDDLDDAAPEQAQLDSESRDIND